MTAQQYIENLLTQFFFFRLLNKSNCYQQKKLVEVLINLM